MSSDTLLLVCDIQERFAPVIYGWDHLLSSTTFMIEIAGLLGIQAVITEQYPKGLGKTIQQVKDAALKSPVVPVMGEKMDFSCLGCPALKDRLNNSAPRTIILVGLETHVCVLQTCLDMFLMYPDVRVLLPVDAVSSSRPFERAVALKRLSSLPNVVLTTCESAAFALVRSASHPSFKAVSALVKARSASLYAPGQPALPTQVRTTDSAQAGGSASNETIHRGEPHVLPLLCTVD